MNEPEFNWYMELDKAIKKEPSEDTYLDLRNRSSSWVTCACGQLCNVLPRNLDSAPVDRQLSDLGLDFADWIYYKNWHKALKILNKIESRTSQLLNEQNNG